MVSVPPGLAEPLADGVPPLLVPQAARPKPGGDAGADAEHLTS
jgi:hypothetical protein